MAALRDANGKFVSAGGGKTEFKFNAKTAAGKVLGSLEKRMEKAVLALKRDVRKAISKKSPPASSEGEPPHVLDNHLRPGIMDEVDPMTRGGDIVGRVGTNVKYARRLELGFVGTDKLGRKINQGPRPYLRATLIENKETYEKILGKKIE